jgi:hypothetical protein
MSASNGIVIESRRRFREKTRSWGRHDEIGGAPCGFLQSHKEFLSRLYRHDFRLVPGEFCDRSLTHVQVLGNHRGRRTGNPV